MLPKIHAAKTKSEQAYQAIKESIIRNELLPGKEISISSLAALLGISPTPVREAVARLSSDGLVHYKAHRVMTISKMTEDNVRQIYEVRRLLEPHAARLLIDLLSQDETLRNTTQGVVEKARTILQTDPGRIRYSDYLEIDVDLDALFGKAAGSGLFGEVYTLVSGRSKRIRTFVEAAMTPARTEILWRVTEEHLSILEAILDGNVKAAQRAVVRHLTNSEARTIGTVKDKLDR